jgi:hypothetical protein
MPRRVIDRIRAAIRSGAYDMTVHAVEEMAEDELDLADIESSILNGRIVRTERDDPRGTRYVLHGAGVDGITPVGTVGRFTGTGRYLLITVYKTAE